MTRSRRGGLTILLLGLSVGCGGDATTAAEALLQVLPLEDARPLDEPDRARLVALTGSPEAAVRRFAVRALGRLEDPTLAGQVTALLADPDPGVRAAAAWAAAQVVHTSGDPTPVAALLGVAEAESDPDVRGAIARSLGRLAARGLDDAELGRVIGILTTWAGDVTTPLETAVGVALGLEALTRAPGSAGGDPRIYQALEGLARFDADGEADPAATARVRSVSFLGLGQRGRLPAELAAIGLADASEVVRATAARFIPTLPEAARPALVDVAATDEAAIVRVESVRATASAPRTPEGCARLLGTVADDPSILVRTLAIDALVEPCPPPFDARIRDLLDGLARDLPEPQSRAWHTATHALAALSHHAPTRARAWLPLHAEHANPFVRADASAVASRLGDVGTLRTLAEDSAANVRSEALPLLFALEGRALDPLLLDQLTSDDPQLLMTASRLLEGSADRPEVAAAAMDAFHRVSQPRRETARDARVALLALLESVGSSRQAPELEPYLTDYDAVVATRVADLLTRWTDREHVALPSPVDRLPLPDLAALTTLQNSEVVLHMARGGTIVVELLPLLAPTNAYRFLRLSREGYFDGLTFHRVVPNFVIQGGSPGANEYAGDGPYTRDEIGRLSHWRGTMGLSTRGRDTGDAQIFVNLVDNVRLDHDYTIFGKVVHGMDVVDAVLRGDVIQRVEIRPKD